MCGGAFRLPWGRRSATTMSLSTGRILSDQELEMDGLDLPVRRAPLW